MGPSLGRRTGRIFFPSFELSKSRSWDNGKGPTDQKEDEIFHPQHFDFGEGLCHLRTTMPVTWGLVIISMEERTNSGNFYGLR